MSFLTNMVVWLQTFWREEKGNEVVTWVVIAALAVGIAAFLLGGIQTALNGAVTKIVSYIGLAS